MAKGAETGAKDAGRAIAASEIAETGSKELSTMGRRAFASRREGADSAAPADGAWGGGRFLQLAPA